jgi:hypothetical protein
LIKRKKISQENKQYKQGIEIWEFFKELLSYEAKV